MGTRQIGWMLFFLAACGDPCPDVSGSYTIVEHCETEVVGSSLTIEQDGCDIEVPEWEFSGTVDKDGGIEITGSPSGELMTCTGQVDEDGSMTSSCDNGCDVLAE